MDFRYQQEDVVAKILKDSIIYNEGTFAFLLNNICLHLKNPIFFSLQYLQHVFILILTGGIIAIDKPYGLPSHGTITLDTIFQ